MRAVMKNALTPIVLFIVVAFAGQAQDIGTWRLLIPKQAYTVRTVPGNPDRIYIGNWANQILVSNDGGATWDVEVTGSQGATNMLTSLHVCQRDTGSVLLGGLLITGIKRSTDGLQTWTQVLQDLSGRQMWFVSEAISEAPDGAIYGARGRANSSIYRSTDNGATWDSLSTIPYSTTERLCTITAHPTDKDLIFLGAKAGKILRSTDAGKTWAVTPIDGKDTIRDDAEIPKIVFSPNNPDNGYAIAAIANEEGISGGGGVLASTDRGLTWTKIAFPDTSFWAVDVRKTETGIDDILIGGFRVAESDTIIKGDSLIYRSLDGGKTWIRYEGIQWKKNEISQTVRNVWSFYRDPTSNKEYMATQLGLYVLDEAMSVAEDKRQAIAKLKASFTGQYLTVKDDAPLATDVQWQLYDMAANLVTSGKITATAMNIPVPAVGSGTYLLVWGSEHNFRTVPVQIIR